MIQRERYLHRIIPFIDKPVIKVITGIRRCGKSTLLKMIRQSFVEQGVHEENLLLVNKDSLEFNWLVNAQQLAQYVKDQFANKDGAKYLFIDEIQEIEGWEKTISGLLTDQIADIYITGSNSRLLSSELATYITGRYVEINLYPLSFSEFLLFRGVSDPDKWESEFGLFMRYGGFPGIHHMEYDDEVVGQYTSAIVSSILLKDVVARNNLRDIALLERLTRFVADNCGNITSSKRIADFLKSQRIKGSVDTIQAYLSMLTTAFIFHKVNRFDIKGKRLLEIHEKYYAGDIGLRNSLIGYKLNDIAGQLENIVYLELLSRGYQVSIGKINDLEIDFIATKNNRQSYFQVAYLLANQKTINREFGALEKVTDNYPKVVLSLDKHLSNNRNGIQWINLIDFLLQDV
ncbi:MAG: ATP-binding protein [Bacteroidales bacterium]|nr:ATP-binding protein [Bacteroidales bacterium]